MVFDQKRTRGLSVQLTGEDKVAVIRFLDRSLNFHVSENLREELKKTIAEKSSSGCSGVVLDLAEVGVIDSCGVGLVISACNQASSLGVGLGLSGVTPLIDRIFDVMRLRRHLKIYPSTEEAAAALVMAR